MISRSANWVNHNYQSDPETLLAKFANKCSLCYNNNLRLPQIRVTNLKS